MKIQSSAFSNGGQIPKEFTCDGTGMNPPLQFLDVPKEAKSLVLIMEDPDVPKDIRPDGMWTHWVLFNIPPKTSEIGSGGTVTGAAHGANTALQNEYMGPCPPDGEHRYFFRLYALDTQLPLKAGASKEEVMETMEPYIVQKAELMGVYKR